MRLSTQRCQQTLRVSLRVCANSIDRDCCPTIVDVVHSPDTVDCTRPCSLEGEGSVLRDTARWQGQQGQQEERQERATAGGKVSQQPHSLQFKSSEDVICTAWLEPLLLTIDGEDWEEESPPGFQSAPFLDASKGYCPSCSQAADYMRPQKVNGPCEDAVVAAAQFLVAHPEMVPFTSQIRIGRAHDATICLQDASISAYHCRLVLVQVLFSPQSTSTACLARPAVRKRQSLSFTPLSAVEHKAISPSPPFVSVDADEGFSLPAYHNSQPLLFIIDESANGTYLNHTRIPLHTPVLLKNPSQRVSLGRGRPVVVEGDWDSPGRDSQTTTLIASSSESKGRPLPTSSPVGLLESRAGDRWRAPQGSRSRRKPVFAFSVSVGMNVPRVVTPSVQHIRATKYSGMRQELSQRSGDKVCTLLKDKSLAPPLPNAEMVEENEEHAKDTRLKRYDAPGDIPFSRLLCQKRSVSASPLPALCETQASCEAGRRSMGAASHRDGARLQEENHKVISFPLKPANGFPAEKKGLPVVHRGSYFSHTHRQTTSLAVASCSTRDTTTGDSPKSVEKEPRSGKQDGPMLTPVCFCHKGSNLQSTARTYYDAERHERLRGSVIGASMEDVAGPKSSEMALSPVPPWHSSEHFAKSECKYEPHFSLFPGEGGWTSRLSAAPSALSSPDWPKQLGRTPRNPIQKRDSNCVHTSCCELQDQINALETECVFGEFLKAPDSITDSGNCCFRGHEHFSYSSAKKELPDVSPSEKLQMVYQRLLRVESHNQELREEVRRMAADRGHWDESRAVWESTRYNLENQIAELRDQSLSLMTEAERQARVIEAQNTVARHISELLRSALVLSGKVATPGTLRKLLFTGRSGAELFDEMVDG